MRTVGGAGDYRLMNAAAPDEHAQEFRGEKGQVAGEQQYWAGGCGECGVEAADRAEADVEVGMDGKAQVGILVGVADDKEGCL